jgi:hypothetical protein
METARSGKITWNVSGITLLSNITSSVVPGSIAPDQFIGFAQFASPPDPVHVMVLASKPAGNKKTNKIGQCKLRSGRFKYIILQNIPRRDQSQYHKAVRGK